MCVMSYRLFLDDVRDPTWVYPDEDPSTYVVCRSFDEAVAVCEARGCPSFVSFDHDLGEDVPTGMDFARWLVERDLQHAFFPENFSWRVHSANPIGAANIEGLMSGYLAHKERE
jgi:hypothetical protein